MTMPAARKVHVVVEREANLYGVSVDETWQLTFRFEDDGVDVDVVVRGTRPGSSNKRYHEQDVPPEGVPLPVARELDAALSDALKRASTTGGRT